MDFINYYRIYFLQNLGILSWVAQLVQVPWTHDESLQQQSGIPQTSQMQEIHQVSRDLRPTVRRTGSSDSSIYARQAHSAQLPRGRVPSSLGSFASSDEWVDEDGFYAALYENSLAIIPYGIRLEDYCTEVVTRCGLSKINPLCQGFVESTLLSWSIWLWYLNAFAHMFLIIIYARNYFLND